MNIKHKNTKIVLYNWLTPTTTVSNSKFRILSNSNIRQLYVLDVVLEAKFKLDIQIYSMVAKIDFSWKKLDFRSSRHVSWSVPLGHWGVPVILRPQKPKRHQKNHCRAPGKAQNEPREWFWKNWFFTHFSSPNANTACNSPGMGLLGQGMPLSSGRRAACAWNADAEYH